MPRPTYSIQLAANKIKGRIAEEIAKKDYQQAGQITSVSLELLSIILKFDIVKRPLLFLRKEAFEIDLR